MKEAIAAGVLLLAATGVPAADSHYEAARQFYEVSKVDDPKGVSRLITGVLAQLQPGLRKHEAALAAFAEQVLASDEYVDAQIRTYRELFSETELRALTRLFRDESFKKYRGKRFEIARRGAQNTMELFQSRLPELEAQIERAEADSKVN